MGDDIHFELIPNDPNIKHIPRIGYGLPDITNDGGYEPGTEQIRYTRDFSFNAKPEDAHKYIDEHRSDYWRFIVIPVSKKDAFVNIRKTAFVSLGFMGRIFGGIK